MKDGRMASPAARTPQGFAVSIDYAQGPDGQCVSGLLSRAVA